MSDANKLLVRRWYDEMWNGWNDQAVDRLVHEKLVFRGSLGDVLEGREAFKSYIQKIQAAFPDFHNRVEELIAEGNKVVARLTYTGTHRGALWGIAPTQRRIEYTGVALFEIDDERVSRDWILGNIARLRAQLEKP